MPNVVASAAAEFRRYKALAEGAVAQLSDEELLAAGPGGTNSTAVILRHVGGNLASRFTEFLTTDGEKPWRKRDGEFETRSVGREELLAFWEKGWGVLLAALDGLTDEDLGRTVTIRGVALGVDEALLRSLAHVSYHVGQVVQRARSLRGEEWRFLSIPPGGTEAYNRAPTMERAGQHHADLTGRKEA